MIHISSRFSVAVLSLSLPLAALAVGASLTPVKYTQPDGTTIDVVIKGDETCHWYESLSGDLLEPLADGSLTAAGNEYSARVKDARHNRDARRVYTTYPTLGKRKALVILVQYTDKSMTFGQSRFDDMLNMPGYSEGGATGSAADWFVDNSAGRFTPEFDVYGPVTLSNATSYYGGNDDAYAHLMVSEAIKSLDSTVDFSQYDCDGDGWVDNVYVFYAGRGEADGGGTNTVWPHSSNLYNKGVRLSVDGVAIGAYACSNEISEYGTLVGIGTFCHEFCHVLGLPDLYCTDDDSTCPTPGYWSVMDHGNYNNRGRTPCNMSAYERLSLGWCEPTVIDGDARLRLESIESNMAYRMNTTDNNDEFFILENRRASGWDAYLPSAGMLVWHVDYDKTYWDKNTVNNTATHQRVDLVEADNTPSTNGDAGDVFPGRSNVTTLTLTDWQGRTLSPTFSSIALSNGVVTLNAGSGGSEAPAASAPEASVIEDNYAVFSLKQLDAANRYVAYLTTDVDGRSRAVAQYYGVDIDNVNSVRFDNLTPSTTYNLWVAVKSGITIGAPSTTLSFTTLKPGITYATPVLNAGTEITDHSFALSWLAVDGADDYVLNVYKLVPGSAESETVDFASRLELPQGWTTSATETMAVKGYCGASTPSLRFTANAQYIQSPTYNTALTSISFWLRGYKLASTATLTVEALVGGNWKSLQTLTNIDNNAGQTVSITPPSGAYALRLTYANTGDGSLCLDDIVVGRGAAMVKNPVVTDRHVGNVTSATMDGLDAATTYYCTVQAVGGERLSNISNTVEVTTSTASSVNSIDIDTVTMRIDGNRLTFSGNNTADITVYDVTGRRVANLRGNGSVTPGRGIFVVVIDGRAHKVAL